MDTASIFKKVIMEALKYFKNKKAEFASNAFIREDAIAFCKRLYKLGATNIDIAFDEELLEDGEELEEIYADSMLVSFPKNLGKRLDIAVAIFEWRPDEVSADSVYDRKVNWRKDKSVFLWWD